MSEEREKNQVLIHEINLCPKPYDDIRNGAKRFIVRHDGRDYAARDMLILREYDDEQSEHTGRKAYGMVTFVEELQGKDPSFACTAVQFRTEKDPQNKHRT